MSNEMSRKRRFNVIDAVIILLIIACIAGVVYRSVTLSGMEDDTKEYKLYLEIDDISSSSLDYFKIGDTFRVRSDGTVLGALESVKVNGAAIGAYNDNGDAVYYPDDDGSGSARIRVECCILVRGDMTERGLLVGNSLYISPNCTVEMISEHINVTAKVTNISDI